MKSPPASTTARVLVKNGGWNFLKCAYMVMTFLFVSYNKGDWVRRPRRDGCLSVYGGRRAKGRRGGEERVRREGTVGGGSLHSVANCLVRLSFWDHQLPRNDRRLYIIYESLALA